MDGGCNADLDAELIGLVGLALADAFDFWGMQRIDLLPPLARALVAHANGQGYLGVEGGVQRRVFSNLAADIADHPAQLGFQGAQRPIGALELFGVGVALMLDQGELADPLIGLAKLDPLSLG